MTRRLGPALPLEELSEKEWMAQGVSLAKTLGFIAITAAVTNIVSGFLITDRMLKMFKKREEKK